MGLFFGSSRRDQVHLLSALRSLDSTSVAGLSAALSWSERKTTRVARELAGGHAPELTFDPSRQIVAIRRARATAPAVAISGGVAGTPTIDLAPPALPVARASPFGTAARCPSCGVPLMPTAQGNAAVCPKCGELSTRRAVASTAAAPVAPAAVASSPSTRSDPSPSDPPLPIEGGRTVVHEGDRRSQELFAAWVTARPIPCPRCRTALRHRGVGEYGCPTCGHRVAFETSVQHLATPKPAAA